MNNTLAIATALAGIVGGPFLGGTPSINRERLAEAICQVESSGGTNTASRFEPDFLKKYKAKGFMPELITKYGEHAAASSYGPYQIMLVRAWELGYKVSPTELAEPICNRQVYDANISRIIARFGDSGTEAVVKRVAGRYNGSGETGRYAQKVWNIYAGRH